MAAQLRQQQQHQQQQQQQQSKSPPQSVTQEERSNSPPMKAVSPTNPPQIIQEQSPNKRQQEKQESMETSCSKSPEVPDSSATSSLLPPDLPILSHQCPHMSGRSSPRRSGGISDEDDEHYGEAPAVEREPLMVNNPDKADDDSNIESQPQSRVDSLASDATFCPVCSDTHARSQLDQLRTTDGDTDSFTPRVRSDKKSVTVLLGKYVLYLIRVIFVQCPQNINLRILLYKNS